MNTKLKTLQKQIDEGTYIIPKEDLARKLLEKEIDILQYLIENRGRLYEVWIKENGEMNLYDVALDLSTATEIGNSLYPTEVQIKERIRRKS